MDLINDEFGNFIIQYIIFMRNPKYNERITDFITENISELAQKKYSSNVIDRVNNINFIINFYLVYFIK